MKSLVLLTTVMRHQAAICKVSLERDIRTLERRYRAEGAHFLEVVLPTLDDVLLEGLRIGVCPLPEHFHVRGELPVFLGPLWSLVFDEDGILLSAPSHDAITAIRQITRASKKVFEVCPDDAVAKEISSFLQTDNEVGDYCPPADAIRLLGIAIDALFGRFLRSTDWGVVEGRHGPGATAERYDLVGRWDFGPSNPEIASAFPEPHPPLYSWPYPVFAGRAVGRLVAVPKTATKPRLISIEPSSHQWIQQSIKDRLYSMFNGIRVCDLRSQDPNRILAEIGSYAGCLATIDLSEASDRISNDLVKLVFSRFPQFSGAIQACRTKWIEVPGHGEYELKKFASMGSALTFPIEVMIFTAITLMGVALAEGGEFVSAVRRLAKSDFIRIYGDDIIVPVEHYKPVTIALEVFGLKVNKGKSFAHGLFRESCGADFFGGSDVAPVYRRRRDPGGPHDTSEIVSLVSFANQYSDRYGPSPIPDTVHELLRAWTGLDVSRHPNPSEFGGLAIVGDPSGNRVRYNRALQRDEVRAYTLRVASRDSRASDGARLRYALDSVRGNVVPDDSDVLSAPGVLIPGRTLSHGVSASTHITTRWVAA